MIHVYTISYPANFDREDFAGLFFEFDSEGFEEKEDCIELYLSDTQQTDGERFIKELAETYQLTVQKTALENKNWNEQWERSFHPLLIDGFVYVHATFHPANKQVPYDIVIEPKMSFGTGHHPTTLQMMRHMRLIDFKHLSVLDCGSGTGILAILAEKLGADKCIALDNDEWCYKNCLENMELNQSQNITVVMGDLEALGQQTFDCILANIHRNFLLENMGRLASLLVNNGHLFISGFYTNDAKSILDKALECNLIANYHSNLENWECLVLQKKEN